MKEIKGSLYPTNPKDNPGKHKVWVFYAASVGLWQPNQIQLDLDAGMAKDATLSDCTKEVKDCRGRRVRVESRLYK